MKLKREWFKEIEAASIAAERIIRTLRDLREDVQDEDNNQSLLRAMSDLSDAQASLGRFKPLAEKHE